MNLRLFGIVLCGPFLSALCHGADPAPEFTPQGVTRDTGTAQILVPGATGMSIYGRYLGPTPPCFGSADPSQHEISNPRQPYQRFVNTSVYPKELCGTQVLIGDKPVGLLYVSDKQINFKIPQDSPENGSADLRVVYKGQSSLPLTMKAGFEITTVELERPAYAGMPVWLKVNLPFPNSIHYPSALGPAEFGCNDVEVRRDGKVLAIDPGSKWDRYGMGFAGAICGSSGPVYQAKAMDRLPLHLLYRFDTPGTYEVRYTQRSRPAGMGGPAAQLTNRSEWTSIEVLPAQPNQRAEWLKSLGSPQDAADLLTDTLPSVLGLPDEASFSMVTAYLYHPDASVRRYAMNGLSYWPEDSTSARLLALVHAKGPSDVIVQYLTRQQAFRAAHGEEIAQASIPALQSDSPVLLEGALAALRTMLDGHPAFRDAVLGSAEHIEPLVEAQPKSDLAQMLMQTKDPRVPPLLRKLMDQGYGQWVAQSLASFADPSDLPRIAALMTQPGNETWIIPRILYMNYGAAAVPYLEAALRGHPERFTTRDIARELMAAGSVAGFQYAVQAIEQKGASRIDIIQAIQSQFPELKAADEAAILAFLKARAGPVGPAR